MHQPPAEQFPSPEHASSADLRLGPGVQPGLDLLQALGALQLQNLLVHRLDQVLQQPQRGAQRLHLFLVPWGGEEEAVSRDTGSDAVVGVRGR